MKLRVGEPIPRDDGRFYIPLFKPEHEEGLSDIVLRVASDAFPDLEGAKRHANMIALSFAQCTEVLSFGMGDPDLAHNLQQVDDYKWALEAYGEVVENRRYQAFRFLEEAVELIQAIRAKGIEFTREDFLKVWDFVMAKPPGPIGTEVGDVQITLNILAMVCYFSVATERNKCLEKLALRTPEQLRGKDKAKMDAGLI